MPERVVFHYISQCPLWSIAFSGSSEFSLKSSIKRLIMQYNYCYLIIIPKRHNLGFYYSLKGSRIRLFSVLSMSQAVIIRAMPLPLSSKTIVRNLPSIVGPLAVFLLNLIPAPYSFACFIIFSMAVDHTA